MVAQGRPCARGRLGRAVRRMVRGGASRGNARAAGARTDVEPISAAESANLRATPRSTRRSDPLRFSSRPCPTHQDRAAIQRCGSLTATPVYLDRPNLGRGEPYSRQYRQPLSMGDEALSALAAGATIEIPDGEDKEDRQNSDGSRSETPLAEMNCGGLETATKSWQSMSAHRPATE